MVLLIFFCIIILINYYQKNKYFFHGFFKEIPHHPHLDYRYGKISKNCKSETLCFGCGISKEETHHTLRYLLKKLMKYSEKRGIKPILMYGGLIGYYFNGKLLPWDDDIDMILIGKCVNKIKNYQGKKYIIEVNPNSHIYSEKDWRNKISARVISKLNGIFIDLTFYIEKNKYLVCKDGNKFLKENIIPKDKNLKKGIFEDIQVYLPNNIKQCLITRYGIKVLKPLQNKGYNFNDRDKIWEKNNFLYLKY